MQIRYIETSEDKKKEESTTDGIVIYEPVGSNSNIYSLTCKSRSEVRRVPFLCSFPR